MTGPLAPGSIGLGLSVPPSPPREAVAQLRELAHAALEAGFDGVTLSEHHGGFPGYLPVPLLVGGLLTAELGAGWAIACPAILPLRGSRAVAEELAWLAAAYPGRVAAGFAPGYQERDFALSGADHATRRERHWRQLAEVAALLRDGSDDDPAIAACAPAGLPLVTGVAGVDGARRAARAGTGLLLLSLTIAAELGPLVAAHRSAGGTGPVVLIRRAWLGSGRLTERFARYAAAGGAAPWLGDGRSTFVTGDASAMVEQLARDLDDSGANALNLRLDVDGVTQAAVRRQVSLVGRDVLPALRAHLAHRPGAGQ